MGPSRPDRRGRHRRPQSTPGGAIQPLHVGDEEPSSPPTSGGRQKLNTTCDRTLLSRVFWKHRGESAGPDRARTQPTPLGSTRTVLRSTPVLPVPYPTLGVNSYGALMVLSGPDLRLDVGTRGVPPGLSSGTETTTRFDIREQPIFEKIVCTKVVANYTRLQLAGRLTRPLLPHPASQSFRPSRRSQSLNTRVSPTVSPTWDGRGSGLGSHPVSVEERSDTRRGCPLPPLPVVMVTWVVLGRRTRPTGVREGGSSSLRVPEGSTVGDGQGRGEHVEV